MLHYSQKKRERGEVHVSFVENVEKAPRGRKKNPLKILPLLDKVDFVCLLFHSLSIFLNCSFPIF